MSLFSRRFRATADTPDSDPANPDQATEPAAIWRREDLFMLLSVSSTLAGLCIAGVSLINGSTHRGGSALADDGMAFSALLFLLCSYAIFFALRTRHARWARRLDRLVDTLFMLALTGMVVCGFLVVYAVL